MKACKWCIFLILILMFWLAGCADTTSDVVADSKEWVVYSSDNFEFEYPASWMLADPTQAGIEPIPEVLLYVDASEDNDFLANLNLVIEEYPFLAPSALEQANSAAEWMQLLEGTTGISNYRQIDFVPHKIGDVQAGIATAEYTISQNGIVVRNQQLIVPLGQQSYILTLTCKADDWLVYEKDFQRIIDSFLLK